MQNLKLNLKQRFDLSRYVRRLPCTLKNRFAVEGFLQAIEFTVEEIEKYQIQVTPPNYELSCTDENFEVEVGEISEVVFNAMKEYIEILDTEENKGNQLLQNTFDAYRIIVK